MAAGFFPLIGVNISDLSAALCPHCHALTIVPALLFRQANVNRLKAYRSNVVIFPRNAKKPRVRRGAVDSSKEAQGEGGDCGLVLGRSFHATT